MRLLIVMRKAPELVFSAIFFAVRTKPRIISLFLALRTKPRIIYLFLALYSS